MMMRVYTRMFEGKQIKIVAVCDKELLGKRFEGNGRVLDLEKYCAFYEGSKSEREEVERELLSAQSINLVGEKSVSVAIGLGLAKRDAVV
ncbi:MAG: DUF424 family protein, partial [Candidatus Micrarchaeia archaeon]